MLTQKLLGRKIFLSASIPDELTADISAQTMLSELTVLCRCIFRAGGSLVFGGHPSITPLLHRAAKVMGIGQEMIELFQLRRFRGKTPREIEDQQVFGEIQWLGCKDGSATLAEDLTLMRKAMIKTAHAAVFVGGRRETRGIHEEYQIFTEMHKPPHPAYLLGFAKGDTSILIEESKQKGTTETNGLLAVDRQLLHSCERMAIMAPLIVRDIAEFDPQSKR